MHVLREASRAFRGCRRLPAGAANPKGEGARAFEGGTTKGGVVNQEPEPGCRCPPAGGLRFYIEGETRPEALCPDCGRPRTVVSYNPRIQKEEMKKGAYARTVKADRKHRAAHPSRVEW